MKKTRTIATSILLGAAIAFADAGLGAQTGLVETPNRHGERRLPGEPKKPRHKKRLSPHDIAALEAARLKRERRARRQDAKLDAGCQRQTATPKARP